MNAEDPQPMPAHDSPDWPVEIEARLQDVASFMMTLDRNGFLHWLAVAVVALLGLGLTIGHMIWGH